MVEPLLDYYIAAYRGWAHRYISRAFRTRLAWTISICAVFVACFLAFQDQFNAYEQAKIDLHKAEGERDEARRQRDANISPALDVEKRARLNLEEKFSARSISQSARETLRAKLIVFKGTTVDILIYGAGSSDALSLADAINEILRLSGWNVRMWSPIGSMRVIKGVLVTTRLGADHSVEAPAAQLINALNAIGIETSAYEQFTGDEAPDNIVGPT